MHLHIIGICGTFMGGVATLARQLGFRVTGSDQNIYPPMSTALQQAGVAILSGYQPQNLQPRPDMVLVGNAISRGNPELEAVLDQQIPYTSGPEWLAQQVLAQKTVIAVAGTHGKTTTTAMVAHLLQQAGLAPGFLIGGVALNFTSTAQLGEGRFFVIEADEYDAAFFDKRPKFLHYRPHVLIMNNLEFDHADIFADLEAIKAQFAILLRTVPGHGVVIYPQHDQALHDVLQRGCWSIKQPVGQETGVWSASLGAEDGSRFTLYLRQQPIGEVSWPLIGKHNLANAVSAAAAAASAGCQAKQIIAGLASFAGVKRRLEKIATVRDIAVYDDFAHHPTAIQSSLAALRAHVGKARIFALLQFGSNTMQSGGHDIATLQDALQDADHVFLLSPNNAGWKVNDWSMISPACQVVSDNQQLLDALMPQLQKGDHVILLSNKNFAGLHEKLIEQLARVPA